METAYDYNQDETLSEKWKLRFSVIEKYGMVGEKDREGYKQLPFKTRFTTIINIWAYFFGPFYYLAKGMWRVAISLYLGGISLAVLVTMLTMSEAIGSVLGYAVGFLGMYVANVNFYKKKALGYSGWNPFSGIKWF